MAIKDDELRDLRERIGRLSSKDQVWLLETVLADNRRRWDEQVAANLAAEAALREWEQRRKATESIAFPPEAKREAG